MRDWGARAAFSIGGREFTWGEVWVHARAEGSWKALEAAVREGVALRDAGKTVPSDEVRADAVAFRRTRRLDAAEDAEAWLAARDLTIAQWQDHLLREALRRAFPPPRRPPAVRDAPELSASGWCSGAFDDMARALAATELGVHRWRPSKDEVAALVQRRKLDWILLDAEVAVFTTDDAAREALQCIRSDGMTLAEVAKLAGVATSPRRAVLEDLEPEARSRLLPAAVGEAIAPVPFEGGSAVFVVRDKVLPDPRSRALVDKATLLLSRAAVERALAEQVVFHEPGNEPD